MIRATSPGLAPADITIHFEGPVAFIPGKTPPAIPRPYVRFDRKGQPNIPQQFGRNNPTSASSSALDHSPGLAADGNNKTFWQPEVTDLSPSWTLDMERGVVISLVKISFIEAANYQYVIEASDDKTNWKLLAGLTQTSKKEASHRIVPLADSKGRYLRITFTNTQIACPRVSEVEVTGMVIEH